MININYVSFDTDLDKYKQMDVGGWMIDIFTSSLDLTPTHSRIIAFSPATTS